MKRSIQLGLSVGVLVAALVLAIGVPLRAQLQQSGGPGSTVTANQGGAPWSQNITQIGGTSLSLGQQVAASSIPVILPSATITTLTPPSSVGLNSGTNIVGFVRMLPAGCTQTTVFHSDTVQVATGAGTSITSTTTCASNVYVNNITNSAVTLRIADKSGTPVIWVGGNADFSVPANSNMGLPFLAGVTFSGGLTAIAGTASALNLHIEGYQ